MPPRHPGIEFGLLVAWLAWVWRMGSQGRRILVLRTQQVNSATIALGCAAIAATIAACESLLP